MSREKHHARYAIEETGGFDIQQAAETVVFAHEASFWERLTTMYLRFRAAGMFRQAEIVQQDLTVEQSRTDENASHWATENGTSKPEKPPVEW